MNVRSIILGALVGLLTGVSTALLLGIGLAVFIVIAMTWTPGLAISVIPYILSGLSPVATLGAAIGLAVGLIASALRCSRRELIAAAIFGTLLGVIAQALPVGADDNFELRALLGFLCGVPLGFVVVKLWQLARRAELV